MFCVYLLYGTHVFLFFFVPRSMAGYIVSISSFLFSAPPASLPFFFRKLHQGMGGFKLSFLVYFKQFSEEDRGGGGFLPLLCTLVTFRT